MKRKDGFIPISIQGYVEIHLRHNRDDTREDITSRLQSALENHRRGVRCSCGHPIWVIGSAVTEISCFTCLTGEARPDGDFEIDEVIESDGDNRVEPDAGQK